MQDYTRMMQMKGGDAECNPFTFISETNTDRELHPDIPYTNIITLTGSFPYIKTIITKPSFLSISNVDNPVLNQAVITISGTPTAGDVGNYSINFIVNNCAGPLPADAYEYLIEIDVLL